MKRFAMALALMCVLSTTILAGDMPTTGAVGQQPQQTTSNTLAGDMPTGGKTEPSQTPAATSSTLLVSVILTVLGLR